jgi:hypothetical protein
VNLQHAPRTVSLYSGTRLDLITPRKDTILLCDLAECLARTDAAFADSGFFSLAQRATILAEHLGREEGPLASAYALLQDAGMALLRSVSPFWTCTSDGLPGLTRSYDQLMAVAHEAVDLDWPCPASIAAPLRLLTERLQLRELMTLRHNVDQEIAAFRARNVQPLGVHLAPVPRDKAWSKWIGSWKVYATAAHLPVTPAWRGMGR